MSFFCIYAHLCISAQIRAESVDHQEWCQIELSETEYFWIEILSEYFEVCCGLQLDSANGKVSFSFQLASKPYFRPVWHGAHWRKSEMYSPESTLQCWQRKDLIQGPATG